MAVNVRIPGVGVVTADNAATEATLQQLVSAISAQQNRSRRADSEIAQASRQQAGYADKAADSLGQMASNAKTSESAARNLFSSLSENITKATQTVGVATQDISGSGVATYLKQLGATAIEVSAAWAKSYSDVRDNPIKQAAGLMATGADAVSVAMAGMVQKVVGKDLAGAAGAIVKAGLQTANTILYNELTQTIKSFATFNKMGASFGGGLTEMRSSAFQAGLMVDQFANAMAKAEPHLRLMGLNTAEASNMVSGVALSLGQLQTEGVSLRNQLRGLGYSTEEQAELVAQYLGNLRGNMTAEKFAALDRNKVAVETRQYAEDLKVLADITGKNAKQAMEEARAKAMEADIMARLGSEEEIKKFQAAYANMPDYAKKGFLEYVSSGGQAIVDQATNIAMAQNAQLKPMYDMAFQGIYDTSKNATTIQNEMLSQARVVGEEQRRITKDAGGGIITMASRFGATGLDQLAGFFNSMVTTGLYTEESLTKSRTNAANMAKLNDDMLKDMVKFQDTMQNYAVQISQALNPAIKVYTDALENVSRHMNNFVLTNVRGLSGKVPPKDEQGRYRTDKPATEPYSAEQYRSDLGKVILESLGDLIKVLKRVPARARGGLITAPELSIVGEAGPEAIIPLEGGKVPVQIAGPTSNLADLNGAVQQIQSSFTTMLANLKNTTTPAPKDQLVKEQVQELPSAISTALETVLSSPSGLVQTMTQVKNQIADDNKMQMTMMQQQIDNLSKLVDAMNDNLRVNERIANELA